MYSVTQLQHIRYFQECMGCIRISGSFFPISLPAIQSTKITVHVSLFIRYHCSSSSRPRRRRRSNNKINGIMYNCVKQQQQQRNQFKQGTLQYRNIMWMCLPLDKKKSYIHAFDGTGSLYDIISNRLYFFEKKSKQTKDLWIKENL